MKSLLILILIVLNMRVDAQSLNYAAEVWTEMKIFPDGTFPACHASTIVETNPGEFMAAWFAGSHEGANDVGIWISRLEKNKWSAPLQIAVEKDSAGRQVPCWNPVLFNTKENVLYLFYKAGPNPREWWGMVMQSSDNGETWKKPSALPSGFLGPIKNKPVQLSDGTIIFPSSTESAAEWSVHVEITDEKLSAFRKINIEADSGVGVIQPTILIHPDNRLQMLCRSRQNVISESWSEDNGLHWSKLSKTSVPNPNSGIDAAVIRSGLFCLVYNPLLQGKDWFYGRNVLKAAVSEDGKNWNDVYEFENEKEGEFSYPAVIVGTDKNLHITYTWNRKNIKYVVLKVKE